jgi:hypothetical protein
MGAETMGFALSFRRRLGILVGLLALGLGGLLLLEPIPQDPAYHRFADGRELFGIPNFNDVVSNAGFALVGVLGVSAVIGGIGRAVFFERADARPFLIFFLGVALVSLGSAYYHWAPSNERLLWDRLPMSVAFMAFASAVVADRLHARAGNGWLLLVLIALGLWSLGYWEHTERLGRGDLRFYAFVQFYPVVLLPVVIWLFPAYRYLAGRYLGWVVAWYGLSKVLEHFDAEVFQILGYTVSGHSLKHLVAAASAFVVVWVLLVHPRSPRSKQQR